MQQRFGFGLFLALAIVLGVFGFTTLSEATLGVGMISLACLCGIFARIIQAAGQPR